MHNFFIIALPSTKFGVIIRPYKQEIYVTRQEALTKLHDGGTYSLYNLGYQIYKANVTVMED